MYVVTFNTRSYHFTDKNEAQAFAKTWNVQAKYASLCGDPNCHCETLCKSFHYQAESTTNIRHDSY